MRGFFKALVCLMALNLPHLSLAYNLELPVVDRAAVFSSEQRESLKQKLEQLRNSCNVSFVILTVAGLHGEAVEAVAEREFREFKIGNKSLDNGLLFVMAPVDHKMRLEVGYGLESDLPDVVAKQLLSDQIAPYFKSQQYFEGTLHLIDLVQNKSYSLPEHQVAQAGTLFWVGLTVSSALLFLVLSMFMGGSIVQKNEMLEIDQTSVPKRLQFFLANEKRSQNWLGLYFLINVVVFGFFLFFWYQDGLTEGTMWLLFISFLTGLAMAICGSRLYQKYTWQDLLNECDDHLRPLVKAKMFETRSGGMSSYGGIDTNSDTGSGGFVSTTTDSGFSDGGSSGGGGASSDW